MSKRSLEDAYQAFEIAVEEEINVEEIAFPDSKIQFILSKLDLLNERVYQAIETNRLLAIPGMKESIQKSMIDNEDTFYRDLD